MSRDSSLAVITGPTAGIGRVFTDRLARRGHALLLISRDQARLDTLAGEVSRTYGVEARVLAADLSREDEIERVAQALEAERDIGVLVNNAGFGTKGMIHEGIVAPQMQMLRLHVLAPMRLSQAVLPGMVARKKGWIINVSSIASFIFSAGNTNYCATKAYLTRFTQGIDAELAHTGVRVQALCPGFTNTEFHERMRMSKKSIADFWWGSADAVVDGSLAAIERGRPVVYVPRIRNKLLALVAKLTPNSVLKRVSRNQ